MNVDVKLNEISCYFKNKIVKGDYEFIKSNDSVAEIKIDGKYNFEIWIYLVFEVYKHSFVNFMKSEYLDFTEEEKVKASKKMDVHLKKYRETVIREEKTKQIEKLKKELESL